MTLAVIKQADENMDKMKKSLVETMEYFQRVYPDIDFSISRNQTELLDYTISNLQQNLSLGFLYLSGSGSVSGRCKVSAGYRT